MACPVEINTGALMKHFRHLEHGPRAELIAATVARRFGTVERVARIGLGVGDATAKVLGHRTLAAATALARAVVSKELAVGSYLSAYQPERLLFAVERSRADSRLSARFGAFWLHQL